MYLKGNRKMAIQFKNKNGEKVTLLNVGPYICDVATPRLIETDDAYVVFGYSYSDLGIDWFLNGTFKYTYKGEDKELSPDWSQGNDDEDRFMLKDYSGNPLRGNYNIEDAKGSSLFYLNALYEGLIGYNGETDYYIEVDGEEVRVDDVCHLLKSKKAEDMILDDDDGKHRFTKTKAFDYNYSHVDLCMLLIMMDRKHFDSLDELIDYINDGVVGLHGIEWEIDCNKMPIKKFAEKNFIRSPRWSYWFVKVYDRENELTLTNKRDAEGVWFIDDYLIENISKTESEPVKAVSKMLQEDMEAFNGDRIIIEVDTWKYYKGKEDEGPDYCCSRGALVYKYWDSAAEAKEGLDEAVLDECGDDGWTRLEYEVKMSYKVNPY